MYTKLFIYVRHIFLITHYKILSSFFYLQIQFYLFSIINDFLNKR